MFLVAAKEEQISEEKSTPEDGFGEVGVLDPSPCPSSCSLVAKPPAVMRLIPMEDGSSLASVFLSHHVCFNVPSKKG